MSYRSTTFPLPIRLRLPPPTINPFTIQSSRLHYYAAPNAPAMRTVHFQFVLRRVHRRIIDRKRYVIAPNRAGVRHPEKVFPCAERAASEQEVGEHELVLRPPERMIPILRKQEKLC